MYNIFGDVARFIQMYQNYVYTDVSKLRDELKKLLIDCGITQRQIADALGATLEVNIIMPNGEKV